jgi:transcriptional regulator with XRE-family HTH domain
MDQSRELARWGLAVKELLRQRGWTQAGVERRIGWTRGYLSQLLAPKPPDLKVRQLLQVFEVIGASFPELFTLLGEVGAVATPQLPRAEVEEIVDQRVRAEIERALELEAARRHTEIGQLREQMRRLLRRRGRVIEADDIQKLVETALVEAIGKLGRPAEEPGRRSTAAETTPRRRSPKTKARRRGSEAAIRGPAEPA